MIRRIWARYGPASPLYRSQRRAAKERTIGEVANRISASVNVESVMQTAAEELGRILQGSNITIRLEEL